MRVGTGKLTYEVVEGWGRLPERWHFGDIGGVAVDSRDRVFVFCRGGHPVIILDREGNFVSSWGEGVFGVPHGICIGPDDSVYTTDYAYHIVQKFTPDGKLLLTLGTRGQASDSGATVGDIFAMGADFQRVKRGAPPFNRPTNVALSPAGEIYVADGYGNARVHKFAPDGRLLLSWGEPGDEPGQFNLPHGVAVSQAGTVYVADRENDRIQVFSSDGEFIAQWTGIWRPDDLYIDAEGRLYVAELGHRAGLEEMGLPEPTPDSPWGQVSVFDLNGTLLARWGEPDCSIPGSFYAPHGIRTDSRGDLYVGEAPGDPSSGTRVLQKFARAR